MGEGIKNFHFVKIGSGLALLDISCTQLRYTPTTLKAVEFEILS